MLHQDKSLYIAIAIPLYKGILFFIVIYIKSRWCVCLFVCVCKKKKASISVSFFWLGDYKILPTLQKLCILPGTRYC